MESLLWILSSMSIWKNIFFLIKSANNPRADCMSNFYLFFICSSLERPRCPLIIAIYIYIKCLPLGINSSGSLAAAGELSSAGVTKV